MKKFWFRHGLSHTVSIFREGGGGGGAIPGPKCGKGKDVVSGQIRSEALVLLFLLSLLMLLLLLLLLLLFLISEGFLALRGMPNL